MLKQSYGKMKINNLHSFNFLNNFNAIDIIRRYLHI